MITLPWLAVYYFVGGAAFAAACGALDRSGGQPVVFPTSLHYTALVLMGTPLILLCALYFLSLPVGCFVHYVVTKLIDVSPEPKLGRYPNNIQWIDLSWLNDDPRNKPN